MLLPSEVYITDHMKTPSFYVDTVEKLPNGKRDLRNPSHVLTML